MKKLEKITRFVLFVALISTPFLIGIYYPTIAESVILYIPHIFIGLLLVSSVLSLFESKLSYFFIRVLWWSIGMIFLLLLAGWSYYLYLAKHPIFRFLPLVFIIGIPLMIFLDHIGYGYPKKYFTRSVPFKFKLKNRTIELKENFELAYFLGIAILLTAFIIPNKFYSNLVLFFVVLFFLVRPIFQRIERKELLHKITSKSVKELEKMIERCTKKSEIINDVVSFQFKSVIKSFIEGRYAECVIFSYDLLEKLLGKSRAKEIEIKIETKEKEEKFNFWSLRNTLAHGTGQKKDLETKEKIEPYLQQIAAESIRIILDKIKEFNLCG